MRWRHIRALLAGGILVTPALTAVACSTFGADEETPSAKDKDGDPSTSDGAQPSDGGPTRDAAVEASDASAEPDGAIAPFSSECAPTEPVEIELNDVAAQATQVTSAVCGRLMTSADVDFFKFNAVTSAPVRVGFNSESTMQIVFTGAGVNKTYGGPAPAAYRAYTLDVTSPGVITIRVSGTAAGGYKLVMKQ